LTPRKDDSVHLQVKRKIMFLRFTAIFGLLAILTQPALAEKK
jgi:hypothetical protein